MILVISGRTASGKSTLACRVAAALCVRRASFGDFVRQIARMTGEDPEDRRVLQDIGQAQVDANPDAFVSEFVSFAGHKHDQLTVIDGLRHESVLEALCRYVACTGEQLMLAFVDVSDGERTRRLQQRGLTAEEITQIETHPSERDVLHALRQRSDCILNGEGIPQTEAEGLATAIRRLKST